MSNARGLPLSGYEAVGDRHDFHVVTQHGAPERYRVTLAM